MLGTPLTCGYQVRHRCVVSYMSHPSFPPWLHALAVISLAVSGVCAVLVSIDEIKRPQKMWIMNLVWPITTLFGSILWLGAYYAWGRQPLPADRRGKPPFPIQVGKGTTHCGAGCTLGDLIVEWTAFGFPVVAVWFGWHTWFQEKTFAVWIPDFILAFLLGVVFQYYTIKPMRHLSIKDGVIAALKADTASISAWQLGMYGVMALIQFGWYRQAFGDVAPVDSAEFWFAMQLAMLAGLATSYPVNWWLLRKGWKEAM